MVAGAWRRHRPLDDRFLSEGNPGVRTGRWIAILSDLLGMERERIRALGICHAVLSAWWSIEDNDPGWGEYSMRCADVFRRVRVELAIHEEKDARKQRAYAHDHAKKSDVDP